jgi:archaellum component FlaC
MMQTTVSGVHCKVICENEIRRFTFTGTEFSSLKEQIRIICSLNKEFVLKYKDDEGDMITLSTNSELSFALSCLDSARILRLCAFPLDSAPEKMEITIPIVEVGCGKKWKRRSGKGCGRGKWRDHQNHKNHGGKWRHHQNHHHGHGVDRRQIKIERLSNVIERISKVPKEEGNFEKRQEKIQKLEHKLNWLQNHANLDQEVDRREMKIQRISAFIEKLSKIPKEEGNFERRQQRIQKLQEKLEWIKSHPEEFNKPRDKTTWKERKAARLTLRIAELEKIPKEEGNFEKRQAKIQDLRQKLSFNKYHPESLPKRCPFTPEQREQIALTKSKIRTLKEQLCSLKMQIKTKRDQLSTTQGSTKENLTNEINLLKNEVKKLKSELVPLRQEICQLYRRN